MIDALLPCLPSPLITSFATEPQCPSQAEPVIRQFERVRPGPEEDLMKALSDGVRAGAFGDLSQSWVGRGLTIGSGDPDLLITRPRPEVRFLAGLEEPHHWALSLLRQVPLCSLQRVAEHLATAPAKAGRILSELLRLGIASMVDGEQYRLDEAFESPLIEVVAIEAKVSRWKDAIRQASKNRLFCHQSYIALPWPLAVKVASESLFEIHRIGLLGIDDTGVLDMVRPAPVVRPVAWHHYYELASKVANSEQRWNSCLTTRCPSRRRSCDSLTTPSLRL